MREQMAAVRVCFGCKHDRKGTGRTAILTSKGFANDEEDGEGEGGQALKRNRRK